jgi:carbamoyl-phosphate synthase large subunit
MRSTGEVMGIDSDFEFAFLKSQLGAGTKLPMGGTVFVSVKDSDKTMVLDAAKRLLAMDYKIVATSGTHKFLNDHGLDVARVNKVQQGRPHIVDLIKDGKVQLVFNTTEGAQAMKDSQSIRASSVSGKVPYYTTAAAALAAVRAMAAMRERTLEVAPLQSYYQS